MSGEGLPKLAAMRWEQRDQILGCATAQLLTLLDSPAFPGWLLHEAARHPDAQVRYQIARHSQVRTDTLGRLADDSEVAVRMAVAGAAGADRKQVERLATDLAPSVRAAAAVHPQMRDEEVLKGLASDAHAQVRKAVARAARYPLRLHLLEFLSHDPEASVREEVAANLQTPVAILVDLAADPQASVRLQIAQHRDTPWELLRTLSLDGNQQVNSAAQTNLAASQNQLDRARGEELWRLLLAACGKPQPVQSWSEDCVRQAVCFEVTRDGFGSGDVVCRTPRPSDLESPRGHRPTFFVVAFAIAVPLENWQDRLGCGWESLSDVPGL